MPEGLQTRRTLVRDAAAADLDALRALAGDPRVADPYFGYWARRDNLPDHYFLPQLGAAAVPERQLVAIRRADGVLVGAVRLSQQYLGYFFAPDVWRSGYASEVLAALCPRLLAETGLPFLSIHVARENLASIRLAERLGCSYHGLIRVPSERLGLATFMDFRYSASISAAV